MLARRALVLFALLPTLSLACDLGEACPDAAAPPHGWADAGPAVIPGADGAPTGDPTPPVGDGSLEVRLRGDLTPRVLDDGLVGQTPQDLLISISRVDLLRSADDPAPVRVLDYAYGSPAVDMSTETVLGARATAELPAGTYSHARMLLAATSFTVDVVVHDVMMVGLPGEMAVVGAFSDTVIDGSPWSAGQAAYTVWSDLDTTDLVGDLPPLPGTPDGTVVQDALGTWLVLPLDHPLTIAPGDAAGHRLTIVLRTYGSFRWQDQAEPADLALPGDEGWIDGAFDVDTFFGASEPMFGCDATGYQALVE